MKKRISENGEVKNRVIRFRVTTNYYNQVIEFCKRNNMTISETLERGLNELFEKEDLENENIK